MVRSADQILEEIRRLNGETDKSVSQLIKARRKREQKQELVERVKARIRSIVLQIPDDSGRGKKFSNQLAQDAEIENIFMSDTDNVNNFNDFLEASETVELCRAKVESLSRELKAAYIEADLIQAIIRG